MENSERLILTAREASQLLGLSRSSVYQGMLTGEIPHVRIGKRKLIPRAALERMLDGGGTNADRNTA
jgi:excisionase family DNA binding protein